MHSLLYPSWLKIVNSAATIASSHETLSNNVQKDVESVLRAYPQRQEMTSMSTVQSNLTLLLKELVEAQEKSNKLSKKGGKANTQKVEAATTRLESASSTWDIQTPFIFEKLQSLDEIRLNTLRDLLTQYETHEIDCLERNTKTVEVAIASLIEFQAQSELTNWADNVTVGKQKRERQATPSVSRPSARTPPPPSTSHGPSIDDNASERSRRNNNDGASGIYHSLPFENPLRDMVWRPANNP